MHASAVCIIHKGGISGEDYNSLNFHTAVHAHGCRHRGGGGGGGGGALGAEARPDFQALHYTQYTCMAIIVEFYQILVVLSKMH